jgi:hypothetical protein
MHHEAVVEHDGAKKLIAQIEAMRASDAAARESRNCKLAMGLPGIRRV